MFAREDLVRTLDIDGLDSSLRAVDLMLRRAAEEAPPDLGCALIPIASGGKRLRAALIFACASGGLGTQDDALNAMCAWELLHVATLVHDDIIDHSEERRGVVTVSHAVGLTGAVVVGDRLIAQSVSLAAQCDPRVLVLLTDALVEMCDAQFEESRRAFDTTRTLEHVLKVAEGKTAKLFETACMAGGVVAGLPESDVEVLGAFGQSFGFGFQLLDDLEDLEDLAHGQGDLREGIFTDAVVTAIERDPRIADMLKRNASDVEVLREMSSVGAVDEARQRVMTAFNGAAAALSELSDVRLVTSLVRLVDAYRAMAMDFSQC